MKRYKRFFEYDPKMMKALNYFHGGGSQKNQIRVFDTFPKSYQDIIKSMGRDINVKTNDFNSFTSRNIHRIVIYNNDVYSVLKEKGIHQNILAWLILNKNLNIDNREFLSWDRIKKVPQYLCLEQFYLNIYFAESYKTLNKRLIKIRDKNFKGGIENFKKNGFNIEDTKPFGDD